MKAYFLNDDGTPNQERVNELHLEAGRWVGTPFVANSSVRGAGVDCVHLAAALYIVTGALREFHPPNYAIDGGQHEGKSRVIAWLESNERFARIELGLGPDRPKAELPACLAPGDALCFKFGMSEHHAGVMLHGHYFIHAPVRRKVVIGTLSDPVYLRCLTTVFRPVVPDTSDRANAELQTPEAKG